MLFTIDKDYNLTDLDYFEEMPLYAILLDFLNYPLFLWEDRPITNNAKDYYLWELISGYLNISNDEVISLFVKNKNINHKDTKELISYKSILEKEQFYELNKLQDNLINLAQTVLIEKKEIPFFNYSAKIKYNISFHDGAIQEHFEINSIDSFCIFAIARLHNSHIVVKRCENCGDFFVPSVRSDEVYCNKVLSNGRTCKQVGYENKINSDEVLREYRKAYKTKNAFKNRNKHNNLNAEKDFKKWVYAAKQKIEDCRNGIITLEEFKEWLKTN